MSSPVVDTARPPNAWTRIADVRRRDVVIILPLTALAALGCSLWLGPVAAGGWFVAICALLGISQLLCRWIAGHPNPDRRAEWGLAAFTFFYTAAYSLLPLMLVLTGRSNAIIAGMAIIGGVAISSTGEYVHSRRIGGAALAALFCVTVVTGFLRAGPEEWLGVTIAVIAVLSFFAYILQYAAHRERAERAVAAALVSAEAANAAKSAFLATMSHEIRTPLNGVLGMVQVMANDPLEPRQRERLEVLRQSGETLTVILNDILDLSRIEAGKMPLDSTPFALDQVVGPVVETFAPQAAAKGLVLETRVSDAASETLQGDAVRLRQIVGNLVSNAVKFTDAGEVRVEADWRDGLLVIMVRDTGPGIARDAAERLFGDFVQLDESATRRHGGTGLGLSICRKLARLMGGDIRLDSRPGEGSEFTVELPMARIAAGAEPATSRPSAQPPPVGSRALRLLAAEDNAVNRMVLSALLEPAGITPVFAVDGAAALEAWRTADWDVVLMDVQMPVMDGLEATRAIRGLEAEQGRARTPIIGLTANGMSHQKAEMTAAGMDGLVVKPIVVAELYEAINAAVEVPPLRAAS